MSTSPLDGGQLPGQQYDESLNIVREFIQQMDSSPPTVGGMLGNNAIEITPNDGGSAQTRTWNLAQIQAAMLAINIAWEDFGSLDLPDVLTALSIAYNSTFSDGSSTQNGTGASAGTYATLSLSIHGSAQAGASIQPDATYSISITPKDNIQFKWRAFFVVPPVTISDILTILSSAAFFNETVTAIPIWQKSVNTVFLRGQQASLSATADVQERVEISLGVSSSNVSKTTGTGTGTSGSVATTTRTIQLPATINAGFAISDSTTATATATATADIAGGTNWTAISETITNGPFTVNASAGPDIPPTPQTAIPTSGLILAKLNVTPFAGFGTAMVRAGVVDFSQFA